MQAQDCLNEELLDDGQAARILGDLNAHVVFNRAAINHINSFTRDDLLNEAFPTRSEAYTALSIKSTKKHKANVIRQLGPGRSLFRTHVVCVTDKDAPSIQACQCSYLALIKRKRDKDAPDCKYYSIEKEGRNLEHSENCLRNSANCPGNRTVRSNMMRHVQTLHTIPLATTGKQVSKDLLQKEEMIVRPQQAKRVLNMRYGITKEGYRNSFKTFGCLQKYFNDEGNARR
jgi:hypothetical protein